MHAEAVLASAELRARTAQRQVEPAHAVDDQAVRGAQFARHDVHRAHMAAVGVEQHQLLHAGARHARADLVPHADQRLGREGERAREARVLGAQADLLGRQEQRRQLRRQQRQRGGHDAVGQHGVHAQRQVRAVLLGRAQRQHRHRGRRVERGEVARRQLGPETGPTGRRDRKCVHAAILGRGHGRRMGQHLHTTCQHRMN
ncbi:hypothetical protein D9M69_498980 [compost metagenome]